MDIIERFRGAVKIKTDWPAGALPGDAGAEAPLRRFQDFLAESYPGFHQRAERWVLSPYSVVYRWPGRASGAAGAASAAAQGAAVSGAGAEKAVLILAHYDVVPAEEEKWTADPFGAEMRDGFIYGRGTLDMKGILIGIMEAAESLCAGGFEPQGDIWFAFGGDEERAGIQGAAEAAKWFAQRGQRFAWILDEGPPVSENQIKGIDSPLALFGIEEKGFLSLDLRVAQQPGHASRPPKVQAAAILGRALCRIAKKPFPWRLIPTVENFFAQLAPLSGGVQSFFMRHARALGGLFFRAVSGSPDIASLLHTTVAMTQLEGSAADNVMPSEVRAVINLRLLHPWTVEKGIGFIKGVIGDERVQVKIHGLGTDPVPASPEHAGRTGRGWKEMEAALQAVYPGVPSLGFLMMATTDSRHYKDLTGGIFRFSPHRLNPREMSLVHGHDERISVENLRRGFEFYSHLLESL
ncbi:MAG: M20/M25/M40 family metallo-hydrolase [Treponema sp.]|jgi:carboxypeptidase PM20D1|nr:M20/M25/M40 family metallo-hydrolase [Treponema sp.]